MMRLPRSPCKGVSFVAIQPRTPAPEDRPLHEIVAMPVRQDTWREHPDYVCRTCSSHALLHPHSDWIWGCWKCNFSTFSATLYFRKVTPEHTIGTPATTV